jgi:predicted transcriptional regulator
MQTLTIEVPKNAQQLLDEISSEERQKLDVELQKALRLFLLRRKVETIRDWARETNPYQSEEELYEDIS